ncbi:hypothetical protein Nepgr_004110 [Nepenthes gracilis]|uniref:SBP-type domain-containing protein n=1 Tax=Nepenthes gracilis TaxID=150966 RepID=A0AAD3S130_NEPGR|nr:hypothetical protein Nepgr_004110 [Nepenthes gracilis]
MKSPPSSRSGPSKRASARGSSASHAVSCSVDGCNSDLSKCRDYHRRHKVCEPHSKTPIVTIGGQAQRFCQQCSRFHSPVEFDEGKRSCRKRLEGHNRRRRKPRRQSLFVNPANFLSGGQDGEFIPFSGSAIIPPPTSVMSSAWPGPVKLETSPPLYGGGGSSCTQPLSASYPLPIRGRQFPYLQGSDSRLHGSYSSPQQPPLHGPSPASGSPSGSSGTNNPKIFCSRLTHATIESDRALSLLSSSPAAGSHDTGLNSVMHQRDHPMASAGPLISGWNYGGAAEYTGSQGLEDHQEGGPGLVLSERSDSASLCQVVFQAGPPAGGPPQTLSFSWE